jgi:beta-glucosidase
VATPNASLVAFRRVELAAGQTRSVELSIPAAAMRIVDDNGNWIYEPGRFVVHAAGASPGPRAVELGGAKPLTQTFTMTD